MLRACQRIGILAAAGWLAAGLARAWPAAAWPEGAFTGRVRIERIKDSAGSASLGLVDVWPDHANAGHHLVCTAGGQPAASQVYWQEPLGCARLRFDARGGQNVYYVYFSRTAPGPAADWRPEAGVLLETRASREVPVKTIEQMRQALAGTAQIQGRSYVPEVFLGLNPHGPTTGYMALFTGYFRAPKGGDYGFATVSSDASYLAVDGKITAEWLGKHAPGGGLRGEHSGSLRLEPGLHRLEYAQIHLDGAPAAVAAWKLPGQGRFEVMPAAVFPAVARYQVTAFEAAPDQPENFYCEVAVMDHCARQDAMVTRVSFKTRPGNPRREARWNFDDGARLRGPAVQHFFYAAGPRKAVLEWWEDNRPVATNNLDFLVHAQWRQRDPWSQTLFDEQKKSLLARSLAAVPARDFTGMLNLAEDTDDPDLLGHLGGALIQRREEFNTPALAGSFFKAAQYFEHRGEAGARQAEAAWRQARRLTSTTPLAHGKASLHLAELLLHQAARLEEAQALLKDFPAAGAPPEDRRTHQLLLGDLSLAQGQLEAARKIYQAADPLPTAGPRPEWWRAQRLEHASLLLRQGSLEAAGEALDRLLAEAPLERLAVEPALLQLALFQARQEYQRTWLLSQRLLPQARGHPRESEWLLAAFTAGSALDKTAEVRQIRERLLREFPYSEAAARAKSQGSGRAPAAPAQNTNPRRK